ncbi:MAG TPA: hypothetical protein VHM20_01860 [Gammaproteobacteria bacterium]|jgi:hypothetical protein|nr:hypothetical protein [Gammaproteobacteria bacterium]
MIKHVIFIVLLSVAVIMAMTYAQQGIQFILTAHDWIADMLTDIFSGGNAGNLTRQLIALMAIPLAVGIIVAIFYWIVKRSWFPYFIHYVWAVWLIQTAAWVIINQ